MAVSLTLVSSEWVLTCRSIKSEYRVYPLSTGAPLSRFSLSEVRDQPVGWCRCQELVSVGTEGLLPVHFRPPLRSGEQKQHKPGKIQGMVALYIPSVSVSKSYSQFSIEFRDLSLCHFFSSKTEIAFC